MAPKGNTPAINALKYSKQPIQQTVNRKIISDSQLLVISAFPLKL